MTVIGKYEVLEEIGRGGFAVVYHARHTTLQTEAALKVLHPTLASDPAARERFLRDGRAASRLEHAHIVRIQRLIEEGEAVAIAMDYFPAGDLRARIQRGPVDPDQALRLLAQVGEALDYAHGQGLIHRDVKPSNILLDPDGNGWLADFGLVRQTGDPRLTQVGRMVGTTTYVSPEQAQDKPGLDGRSDQYSLAVTAFELLAGAPPFEGDNSTAVALMHITQPAPAASQRSPQVPPEVDEVLQRALAKEPAARYPSCAEFVRELGLAWNAGQASMARGLIQESEGLLGTGQLDEALQKLSAARKLVQGRPEMQAILARLEETRQSAEAYELCRKAWEAARQKGQSVLDLIPAYPDPRGVFARLGLRAAARRMPPARELLRQGGAGLLLGAFLGGLLLFLTFLLISGGS